MINHFLHLFEYDDWANRLTLDAIRNQGSDRSRQILAHILITKQEYFDRFHGKDSTGFNFWSDLSVEQCEQLLAKTTAGFERLLKDADDAFLERMIPYKTSKGVPFENTYLELLTHILFHASIHRGTSSSKCGKKVSNRRRWTTFFFCGTEETCPRNTRKGREKRILCPRITRMNANQEEVIRAD